MEDGTTPMLLHQALISWRVGVELACIIRRSFTLWDPKSSALEILRLNSAKDRASPKCAIKRRRFVEALGIGTCLGPA